MHLQANLIRKNTPKIIMTRPLYAYISGGKVVSNSSEYTKMGHAELLIAYIETAVI